MTAAPEPLVTGSIEPLMPHDGLSFDELASRYNFRKTSSFSRVFAGLVIEECKRHARPPVVLDVGCGNGIGGRADYLGAIRAHASELWGVEPDETAPPRPEFDQHRRTTLEAADLPPDHFDLAYSLMVMEHVVDVDAFMKALVRTLKPGGTYLFMTPNGRHYFTRIASLLHRLRLDELVLRIVRRQTDYHHPVEYRFNSETRINRCAERLGLAPPLYAYVEEEGPIGYMPGPLRPIFHVLSLKRRLLRNPRALITMACRVQKPDGHPPRGRDH